MRRAVVDLASTRPIWSIPAGSLAAIVQAFGSDWEVREISSPRSSDGDGSGVSAEALQAAVDAEVYFGWGIPAEVVTTAADTLRWVHSAAAGVGGSLTPNLRASGAKFTASRAIQAEPMADWVLAAIAFCARGFHDAVRAQHGRRWIKADLTQLDTPIRELSELRVGLVGLGGIGRAVARRCVALGMTVRAVRRHPAKRCPKGVRWIGGPADLPRLVQNSDVLVIAAPYTAATRRLVDDEVLSVLPRGGYVLNVSRGAVLDEEALLRHLDTGRVGACVLDVFDQEPLPPDHPLWTHPRVLVTPHVSGVSRRFWKRETELIVENIERYMQSKQLKNLVDFEAGY